MKRIIIEECIVLLIVLFLFCVLVYFIFINKGIFPSKQEYINRKDLSKEKIQTCLKIKKYFEIPFLVVLTAIFVVGFAASILFLQDIKYVISGDYPQFSGEIITEINTKNKRTDRDHFTLYDGKQKLEILAFSDSYRKGDHVTVKYLPHIKIGVILDTECDED